MGVENSPVESDVYLSLVEQLLADVCLAHPHLCRSFERDMAQIRRRVANEGIQFLTVALPRVGKAMERALETSILTAIPGFKTIRNSRHLPQLFSGLWLMLFDMDGRLRPDASPYCVQAMRQLTLMFYKLELPYTAKQEAEVVEKFVKNEETISSLELNCDELLNRTRQFIDEILTGFDFRDVEPRHGPGRVATGEKGEQKWTFKRLYNAIHQVYPYYDYFVTAGWRQLVDRVGWYKNLDRCETGVAKVCLVPKDSRGPRLISCEPLEYQWIQQGLGRKLMEWLQRHELSRGHVNFSSQATNQDLAKEGSKTRAWATLDLQDASDLVSLSLVRRVFSNEALRFLEGTRTSATRLPDGRVQPLRKFAPMGSALCFPVESLVFYAVSVAAISLEVGCSLRHAVEQVYVYGDDIIVSTPYVYAVMSALHDVGLKVNTSKSFVNGFFRESCGMDAFKGVDVTITRVRQRWTASGTSGSALASWVALCNHLYEKGFVNAANHLRVLIGSRYGKIPVGSNRASGICYHFDLNGQVLNDSTDAIRVNETLGIRRRVNKALQRVEYWGFKISQRQELTGLDGWERLLRNLILGRIERPDYNTVREAVRVRAGWVTV